MDSVCSVLALQKLLNFFSTQRNSSQEEFDVVVYDCNNTEEILRLIGATERARYRFSLLQLHLSFPQEIVSKLNAGATQKTGLT